MDPRTKNSDLTAFQEVPMGQIRLLKTPVKQPLTRHLKAIFMLLSGSLISAFALHVFFIPTQLTMGGVSGLVSIVFQLTGRGQFLPFGTMVILLNVPILILGWIYISTGFVWRSIIGTLAYSLVIDLVEPVMLGWFEQYVNRPLSNGTADPLIFTLFGGILYGIGLGLIFRAGFTTGGTDIVAMLFKRKFRHMSIGQFLMIIDASIVLLTLFFYRDQQEPAILLAMYSFIAMYLTSKSIDVVLEGFDYIRTAYIISDHGREIGARIMSQLERGVTALHGEGLYTGQNKEVLLCVLSKKQIPALKKIVAEIDAEAFIIVSEAREVLGEGFGNSADIVG